MEKVDETAAAGSTGAGSIAVVPSNRLGGMQTRMNLKDYMLKFHQGIANRYRFHPVAMEGSVGSFERLTESSGYPDQLKDVTSRLKDLQNSGEYDNKDIISYGVRDDTGNMMIITVPLQQSEEFEQRIAQTLADVLDFKKTGKGEDKSLAELLYELKDEFTIITAEFPKLPKDAVYNADEITEADPDPEMGDDEGGADSFGGDGLGDLEGGDDEGNPNASGSEDDLGDLEGDPEDEDMGDDFESGDSKEDLMVSVLGMLKSQNEKETAQANAEAEQAKAKQAEIAMMSSKDTVAKEEELISAQAEMDAVKDKEKSAKKMRELATFNYKKKMAMGEGFSELFTQIVLELDANDTPQTLRRQMVNIRTKYKIGPEDDLETKQFKQKQSQSERKELQIRMRAARNRTDYEDDMDDKERDELDKDQEQQRQDQDQLDQRQNDRGRL